MTTTHKKRNTNTWKIFRVHGVLIIILISLATLDVYGQQPDDWSGEIEDVEIVIENKRVIELPKANRHFEKIPPRAVESSVPSVQYNFQSFNFVAPQINAPIRPLKIKSQQPSKIYGGFVRAGFGNYASPLLEGYINSRKNKDQLIGAHLYHSSSAKGPVDGRNSGSGTTTASVFGKSFNQYIALDGSIDAENRTTHFYGYPDDAEVDRSDIKQSYNLFRASGSLSNTKNSDLAYKLGAQLSYMADKYEARETEVDIAFNSSYTMSDENRIDIDAAYIMLRRKDEDISSKVRNLFTVSPTYAFMPVPDLKLRVGLTIAYENDTLDSKDLHVYPNASASYPISPSVDFIASLTGGIEKVSLQTLSNENIWIGAGVPLFHTNKYFDLNVGVNARLGNKVGVHSGLSIASLKNMHFFVNSAADQSKFDVIYDDDFFRRTNLFASLSYAQSEKVKFLLRGDVFSYGTDNVKEAWHLPRYTINANASFNVYDKLLFNIDVLGQGGMKALRPDDGETVKLDGALDLNAKAEYLFSPSFSFFVQFNNIASTKYPVYLYYPVRGLQVMAGVTWSF